MRRGPILWNPDSVANWMFISVLVPFLQNKELSYRYVVNTPVCAVQGILLFMSIFIASE